MTLCTRQMKARQCFMGSSNTIKAPAERILKYCRNILCRRAMEDLDDRRKKGFSKLTPFGAVEEPVGHHAAAQTVDPPPARALVYSSPCHAMPSCHVSFMQTWDGASAHLLCCTAACGSMALFVWHYSGGCGLWPLALALCCLGPACLQASAASYCSCGNSASSAKPAAFCHARPGIAHHCQQ